MSQQLNPRILEKLKQTQCHEVIKQFLREMLFFELDNVEEARPRFSKAYDTAIERHARRYADVKKNAV